MFSKEERVCYKYNQLGEVICQLRFPEILTIEANIPADFQEAIRDEFPRYSLRKETPMPKLSGAPRQSAAGKATPKQQLSVRFCRRCVAGESDQPVHFPGLQPLYKLGGVCR